jgi:hypothetical protein
LRTKSKAQEELEQYEMLFEQVNGKLAEKQMWHDLALSITAQMGGERVQSSGTKDKMGEALTKCLAVEDEIASQVDKLIAKQKEISERLERLDKPIEYKLLHMKYILFKPLKEIADKCGADYTWATTVHGRALKSYDKTSDQQG